MSMKVIRYALTKLLHAISMALCALFIALVFLSPFFPLYSPTVCSAQTYKVGAVFSTTGPASNLGVPEENTVDMMVDQINQAGGINGHLLEVIVYDDWTDAEMCVLMVTRLKERAALLGFKRYMIRALRPVYRWQMLRQSPFYRAKGEDQ